MRSIVKCSALVLGLVAGTAAAQSDRAETWEVGVTLLDLSSVSVAGPFGASISVDDETGFGFTGVYNFTERLGLGMDISWSDPGYVATLVPDAPLPPELVRANLDVNVIHFKGVFNVLESDFTPYLEVGGGWTYLDSNIIEGVSGPVCWWDPWYGYICSNYYDTYTDTRTSISYAVGIRWEIDSSMVLKAAWGAVEIDTNRNTTDLTLDSIQLSFAWMF